MNKEDISVEGLDEIMQEYAKLCEDTGLHFPHLKPFEAMNAGALLEQHIKRAFIAGKRKANLENQLLVETEYSKGYHVGWKEAEAEKAALQQENQRLRKAIEEAPHASECRWSPFGSDPPMGSPCDCWKSQFNKERTE